MSNFARRTEQSAEYSIAPYGASSTKYCAADAEDPRRRVGVLGCPTPISPPTVRASWARPARRGPPCGARDGSPLFFGSQILPRFIRTQTAHSTHKELRQGRKSPHVSPHR